jgi:hypothetical protein
MSNLDWELQAYGASKESILESVKESFTFKVAGPGMIIAGYLSDAQEMIEYDSKESARRFINIAKMLMMEFELGFKGVEA